MPRPRFSLATLLWLVVVVAAFLGGAGWQYRKDQPVPGSYRMVNGHQGQDMYMPNGQVWLKQDVTKEEMDRAWEVAFKQFRSSPLAPVPVPATQELPGIPQVPQTNEGLECIETQAFGKIYKSTVTADLLCKTPAWDEEADSPPVSPRNAIRLAEKTRDSLTKVPDGWKWEEATALFLAVEKGHCAWQVTFIAFPIDERDEASPNYITLIVLMDGTVVEPTVEEAAPEAPATLAG